MQTFIKTNGNKVELIKSKFAFLTVLKIYKL